jgi:succinate dehydrogenase / fumarate reductase iron-sulfur subunit
MRAVAIAWGMIARSAMSDFSAAPESATGGFEVRVLRQDRPGEPAYWQRFQLTREPGLNVTSVLQRIAAAPLTIEGEQTTPVAYDANCLEEVCGSCTMVINGRVRQACSALVDRLLQDSPGGIELRPMSKFPVVRDLLVDRRRLFRALEKLECWLPVDGYYDAGPGPRQSPDSQERAYPLSQCMSCGCCLEACPQYRLVSVERQPEETDQQFRQRQNATFDSQFIGAHAQSQVVLMNSNPTGELTAARRIEALIAEGGIQNCGKAANCQAVCPKEIPLMTSWGRAGRMATLHTIKQIFGD